MHWHTTMQTAHRHLRRRSPIRSQCRAFRHNICTPPPAKDLQYHPQCICTVACLLQATTGSPRMHRLILRWRPTATMRAITTIFTTTPTRMLYPGPILLKHTPSPGATPTTFHRHSLNHTHKHNHIPIPAQHLHLHLHTTLLPLPTTTSPHIHPIRIPQHLQYPQPNHTHKHNPPNPNPTP